MRGSDDVCIYSYCVSVVTKLLRLQEQVKSVDDTMELIKMYDKMGDLCHSLQAHQVAISCYQQEVGDIFYCCILILVALFS